MAHGVTVKLGRCRNFILAGVRAIALPVAGGACLAGTPDLPPAQTLAQQRIEYDSDTTKTILELQPFRSQSRASLRRADGTPGVATLTNLNPYINAWYLLTLQWQGDPTASAYHLEDARSQALRLLPGDPDTLRLAGADGSVCTLWTRHGDAPLETARRTRLPYAPVCGQQLYLRNPVAGHQTSLEQVTDFLRDRVWGGEQVISFVKETLYQDSFIERRGNDAGDDIA